MAGRRHYLATLLCAALAVASASVQTAETKTVTIRNMEFQPSTLTVNVGDTIVWRNADMFAHNVVAKGSPLTSEVIEPNSSWRYTASKKGDFAYICTLHPSMKGRLIVK